MALFVAVFAAISEQVAARISAHRTVALGLAIMLAGLYLFARQGLHATYLDLMPGFGLFGAGAGLMNAPLTNTVLEAMPADRSGVASALLNASREVAGLLGITVIGAVLSTREGAALRSGADPARAFLDGYHAGLAVTIALIAAGIVVAMVALRRTARPAVPVPVPAEQIADAAQPNAAEGAPLAGG